MVSSYVFVVSWTSALMLVLGILLVWVARQGDGPWKYAFSTLAMLLLGGAGWGVYLACAHWH